MMWPHRKFALTVEERHAEASKRAAQELAAFAKMLEDADSKPVMEGPGGCSGFLQVAYSMWQEALRHVEVECTIAPAQLAGYPSPYITGVSFETKAPEAFVGALTDEDLKALGIDPAGPRPQVMHPVPHPFAGASAIISSGVDCCKWCGEVATSGLHQEPGDK
jgi:hypothetical protein